MDNEDDPEELVRQKWNYRVAHWENIVTQQFQLSYYGTVSYDVSSEMPIHEREFLFGLLRDQKEQENKARQEAIKSAQHNTPKSRPPRKSRRR